MHGYPSCMMQVINRIRDLTDQCVGGICVPTMGALHAGHRTLIEYAARHGCRPVVVTIFVNPTQFGPTEDYTRYPRTLAADCEMCRQAGADFVLAPAVDDVYPGGPANCHQPALPEVATMPGLEDAGRPGHFAGVCQVVYRLFEIVKPSVAVFGEKDYQQLAVIRAMVEAENLDVEIIGQPTVRDPDGLALSSRNVYLAPAQRQRALGLSKALREAARPEHDTPDAAEQAMRTILLAHQVRIDYAVVRDSRTLLPLEAFAGRTARALIAGRVGTTRLIDNADVSR